MYDQKHFTRDAASVRFDENADGITTDDGDPQFDWDAVETVRIDQPPHAAQFDTKTFHKLPATVAKPIPQPYQFGEDTVWLKKPREELKQAAWSLDNAPWTLGHPDTGMVKSTDDVRGFWSDPRYHDGLDDLDADLYVPTDDSEAKEFLEANGDVSVGFYNRVARTDEYDGVVGGTDDSDVEVEGYQTDMLFDHCASVAVGRCPSGAGCGLSTDSSPHGHIDAVDASDGTTSVLSEESADAMEVGSWVEWDSSGGTAYGKVDEIVRDGCTTRGKGDMEVCAEDDDPAVVVEVYDNESGESTEEMVRHKMSELRSWSGPSTDAHEGEMGLSVEDRLPEGAVVHWDAIEGLTGYIVHAPEGEPYYMVNILQKDGDMWMDTKRTVTAGVSDVWGVEEDGEQVMATDVVEGMTTDDVALQSAMLNGADPDAFKSGMGTTDLGDERRQDTSSMQDSTHPDGLHVADGMWFAIGPDEHPDESTEWPDDAKFPVDSCEDINDAWNLRGTGDISIEQSTLAERIKRAAEAKDCDLPDTAEEPSSDSEDGSRTDASREMEDSAIADSAKRYSICGSRKEVMRDALASTDCGTCEAESDTDNTMNFEFDDLSTEAALAKVEAEHDGVSEYLDDLRDAQDDAEVAREAAEELDLDDTEDLVDKIALMDERNDELSERVDELQRPKMEEDAAFIAERTDRFGEDAEEVIENFDENSEEIADKREIVEELTDGYDEQTANPSEDEPNKSFDAGSGYAKTPW